MKIKKIAVITSVRSSLLCIQIGREKIKECGRV
jgi:hypothetical protein